MIAVIADDIVILDFCDIQQNSKSEITDLTINTFNTWQMDRSYQEKEADTKLGKFAEDAFVTALGVFGVKNYHSYDEIRNDDFKSHAPFDGFFCKDLTKEIIDIINNAVLLEGSKLSAQTRTLLRNKGVVTVEIKSTRLADKYKEKADFHSYSSKTDLLKLVHSLEELDYLTYPYFTRYGNMSFDEYCVFAEKKLHTNLHGEELKDYITNVEKLNSDDIYVRVFIDEVKNKCFIMGWIDSDTFFTNPTTHKLYLKGKSEVPLYFVKSIKLGHKLSDLTNYLNEKR